MGADDRRPVLLGRVAEFYRQRFGVKDKARNYLAQRGIADKAILAAYAVGYSDNSLKDSIGQQHELLPELREMGVLHSRGELLRDCVTFPLWDLDGNCTGMCGRRLYDSDVNHLYLPGQRRGLVAWQQAAQADELVLCESVIDAMSLAMAGVPGVLTCYGTAGFTRDHQSFIKRYKPNRITICFDGDQAGREAAGQLSHRLRKKGLSVAVVELPDDTDPNDLLVSRGAEFLKDLVMAKAKPLPSEPAPKDSSKANQVDAGNKTWVEESGKFFILHIHERQYEVKGISRQGTSLRVTIKASASSVENRFEISTIDLYSARSRRWFAEQVASMLETDAEKINDDLAQLISQVEKLDKQPHEVEPSPIELTDVERAEALRLLQSRTLMDDILRDFETMGYVGERTNKMLGYLVAVSRKLEQPLSLLIQSRSGAGKSALQDAIVDLVPDEDVCKYSRITDQALFYKSENSMVHKLLAVEEAAGMGGAVYSIRAMQSSKKLTIAATGKDPVTGQMRTDEYQVRGPVSVMMTTTQTDFDQETLSRFITVTVDESSEMTRMIHEAQRHSDTIEGILKSRTGDRLKERHCNAQRLLQPLVVANPYAPKLSFPTERLAARRDHMKYLGLMKAIAFLHQHQRTVRTVRHEGEELKYIEVSVDDIARANALAAEALGGSSQDLTPQGRRLLGLIRGMVGGAQQGESAKRKLAVFSRRQVREHTGWSNYQVNTHLEELVELEYLYVRAGQMGKEYLYELGDCMDELKLHPVFGLTDVEELRLMLNAPVLEMMPTVQSKERPRRIQMEKAPRMRASL